jgi:mercuric ion binding protein
MRKLFSLFSIALIVSSCNSSLENAKTLEFKVWGNCGMCKKTIEGSLKDKLGLYSAEWNVKSKQMKVVIDSTKVKSEEVHNFIAASGYDTDLMKGDDQAYAGLHSCCKYDRKP